MNEYIIYLGNNIFAQTDDIMDAYNLYADAKDLAEITGMDATLVWEANAEVVEYYDPCF